MHCRGGDWGHYLEIIAFADANTVRLCDSRKTQQKYDFLYILLFVFIYFFSMQKHNDINNAYTRNSLTNWLHLQVNSAGGWIWTRGASLPAASPPSLHSPGEPLFHAVVSTDLRLALFSTETCFTKDSWTKSMWEKKSGVLPCDGFISYLLEVYIYIFYKNVTLLINGRGRSGFAVHSLQGHWK